MKAHKKRIDRLEQSIGGGDDDDTILIIRLGWPEDDKKPPIVCRRTPAGKLVKVGIDTVPSHLRRPAAKIDTVWNIDDLDILEG